MKNKYMYIIALVFFFFATTSCDELSDFGDTNDNPAATSEPILSALLTNVEAYIGGYAANTRAGLYGQYFSQTQYTSESLYSTPQLSFSGSYSGYLMDLQNIIDTDESNNMNQVAKILQQYIFWTITDEFGPVPYTEALQGNFTPVYDSQETIYKGMITALTEAIEGFDDSSIDGDIIFDGDVDSWKKTANSLRMLMALRLSKVYSGSDDYAATQFKAALNDDAGYISSNEENFEINYPGGNFKSEWYDLYDGRKDYGESETMTDITAALSDPRQDAFGGATQDLDVDNWNESSNIGVPYGLERSKVVEFTDANTTWARILRGEFREEDGTVVIVSAAQIALARAEAADYGWTSESFSDTYEKGIELSFEQWSITESVSDYVSQTDVALSNAAGSGSNLEKIAIQRYLASYPDGLQGWSIWRKTGYPELTPAPDATNSSGEIPVRYVYSTSEYSSNEDNVNAAVNDYLGGEDSQDTNVWWDQ